MKSKLMKMSQKCPDMSFRGDRTGVFTHVSEVSETPGRKAGNTDLLVEQRREFSHNPKHTHTHTLWDHGLLIPP